MSHMICGEMILQEIMQSQPSGAFDIYSANYYIMNSDYRVYICLFNNANPENNNQGGPSLDEPTFTDLEPRAAGSKWWWIYLEVSLYSQTKSSNKIWFYRLHSCTWWLVY